MSKDDLAFLVVTPTLNPGPWITETIASVAHQTYPYREHWIIDGGSSWKILSEIAHWTPHIRLHVHPGLGQAAAINWGWQHGRGTILSWLNADDTLMPEALARVAAAFREHPEADVVYGRCLMVDEHGQTLGEYPVRPFTLTRLFLHAENFLAQPAVFIRRQAVESVGYLREDLHYVMDYALWLDLALAGFRFVFLDAVVARFRLHPYSKTLRHTAAFGEELIQVFRDLERRGLPPTIQRRSHEMWGWVYYQSARYAFWGGRPALARRYLYQALRHYPAHLRRRNTWLLLILSLLGRMGWRWALQIYGHPWMKAYVPHH